MWKDIVLGLVIYWAFFLMVFGFVFVAELKSRDVPPVLKAMEYVALAPFILLLAVVGLFFVAADCWIDMITGGRQ